MALNTNDPRFAAIQLGCVAAENDVLLTMVSCSIAELSIRYGSEVVEGILTEMLVSDQYHDMTAAAREERQEAIDTDEMKGHDIVSEARAVLDEIEDGRE